MKLVVEYSTGAYDSYCNHTYCVEYDSKEQFITVFIAAFEAWVIQHKIRTQLCADLATARASKHTQKMSIAWEAWKDFTNNTLYHCLLVDGCVMAVPEDYDSNFNLNTLPEIYTLDEWFEEHRPVAS
jgi:hypothetical protein